MTTPKTQGGPILADRPSAPLPTVPVDQSWGFPNISGTNTAPANADPFGTTGLPGHKSK